MNFFFVVSVPFFLKKKSVHAGFPPIREFREIFEDFFQSGKSGENGVFSQNKGKKFQNHFQTFLSEEKCFFKTAKAFFRTCQEITLNDAIFACHLHVTEAIFKKNKYVLF